MTINIADLQPSQPREEPHWTDRAKRCLLMKQQLTDKKQSELAAVLGISEPAFFFACKAGELLERRPDFCAEAIKLQYNWITTTHMRVMVHNTHDAHQDCLIYCILRAGHPMPVKDFDVLATAIKQAIS